MAEAVLADKEGKVFLKETFFLPSENRVGTSANYQVTSDDTTAGPYYIVRRDAQSSPFMTEDASTTNGSVEGQVSPEVEAKEEDEKEDAAISMPSSDLRKVCEETVSSEDTNTSLDDGISSHPLSLDSPFSGVLDQKSLEIIDQGEEVSHGSPTPALNNTEELAKPGCPSLSESSALEASDSRESQNREMDGTGASNEEKAMPLLSEIDLDAVFGCGATDLDEEYQYTNEPQPAQVSSCVSQYSEQHAPEYFEADDSIWFDEGVLDQQTYQQQVLDSFNFNWSQLISELHALGTYRTEPLSASERDPNNGSDPAFHVCEVGPAPAGVVHHYNFLLDPIYQSSRTSAEVSLWAAIVYQWKGKFDPWSRQGVLASQAGKWVDPINFTGPLELLHLGGTELREAVTGYVDKVYHPRGTWCLDHYDFAQECPKSYSEVIPYDVNCPFPGMNHKFSGPQPQVLVGSWNDHGPQDHVINDDGRVHVGRPKGTTWKAAGPSRLSTTWNYEEEDAEVEVLTPISPMVELPAKNQSSAQATRIDEFGVLIELGEEEVEAENCDFYGNPGAEIEATATSGVETSEEPEAHVDDSPELSESETSPPSGSKTTNEVQEFSVESSPALSALLDLPEAHRCRCGKSTIQCGKSPAHSEECSSGVEEEMPETRGRSGRSSVPNIGTMSAGHRGAFLASKSESPKRIREAEKQAFCSGCSEEDRMKFFVVGHDKDLFRGLECKFSKSESSQELNLTVLSPALPEVEVTSSTEKTSDTNGQPTTQASSVTEGEVQASTSDALFSSQEALFAMDKDKAQRPRFNLPIVEAQVGPAVSDPVASIGQPPVDPASLALIQFLETADLDEYGADTIQSWIEAVEHERIAAETAAAPTDLPASEETGGDGLRAEPIDAEEIVSAEAGGEEATGEEVAQGEVVEESEAVAGVEATAQPDTAPKPGFYDYFLGATIALVGAYLAGY